MLFNSLEYCFFLPCVWLIYLLLGHKFRWLFLLLVSYLFYASFKDTLLVGVIGFVTVITYFTGLKIQQTNSETQKRFFLWGGVSLNVLTLLAMKYIPFFADNLNALLALLNSSIGPYHTPILIALGVSYYVFQAISYLVDIFLEIEDAESHFGYFALYLAFFPKLLQGPIERGADLLPQLKQKYEFNFDNIYFGLQLFAWGLLKKVIVADRFGGYVDVVYSNVEAYQGLTLILATYAYAFQIYFDFSGYTDMALGTARLFNIKLTNNFNQPYLATSIPDFWRRWHISFSRWILDYIFRPLQMRWRNSKKLGTAAALLVTFFISGVWHGANWGFVLWGVLHGLYMVGSFFYKPYQKKIHKALHIPKNKFLKYCQIFITFNLVSFAWIFFRVNSFSDISTIFSKVVLIDGKQAIDYLLIRGESELIVLIILIITISLYSFDRGKTKINYFIGKVPIVMKFSSLCVLIMMILLYGKITSTSQFIYFNF